MREFVRRAFAAIVLALGASLAHSQNVSPQIDGDNLTVSLLTFGPGTEVWERFGHNAILIRDAATGQSRLYNYGIFDFDQENFFVNFARGRMMYRMAVDDPADELPIYREEGRWIVQQDLNLRPDQRAKLAQFLENNARPENQYYRYNYFTANCSTRTRDALDTAADGAIHQQTISPSRGFTYRMDVMRLMRPEPLLMLGMDAGLGPYADRRLSYWDESFVPMQFMQALREVTVTDATGAHRVPLVAKETRIADARIPDPDEYPPNWFWQSLAIGVALGFSLLGLARLRARTWARVVFAMLSSTISLVLGIGGLLLLVLWFLTDHESAWRNQNLMLLDPLCLLLLPAWIASRRKSWSASTFARNLTFVIALLAGLALFVKVFQDVAQDNRLWIALLLPIHVALAISAQTSRRFTFR